MARDDRRRRHHPRGRRRPHRPATSSPSSWRSTPSGRCKIGSFSAASNVTGIVSDTVRHLRAAPPARRAVLLGLRRCRAVRRHRDGRARPTARWPTRTPSSCRRTSSSAGRRRPGCWWRDASCSPTACPTYRAAARSPTSTPTTTATSTTSRCARRAARRRSSSRSGPGWSSSSRRPSAPRPSAARRGAAPRARGGRLARRARRSSCWATSTPTRLSIVSFVVRSPSGRYLHHNYVVSLLNDLFGIQARGGCSCAGPYGHRLLGIDLDRSHEFEREITGGCEGIKPGWVRVNFNYFVSDTVADYIVGRRTARRPRRLAAARGLPVRHRDRTLAAPRRARRAADQPARDLLRRGRGRGCRSERLTGGEDLLAEHLRDGAEILAAAAATRPLSPSRQGERGLRAPALVRPPARLSRRLTGPRSGFSRGARDHVLGMPSFVHGRPSERRTM